MNTASLGHRCVRALITFVLIDLSWVFFRAPSVSAALQMLRSCLYLRPFVLFDGSLLSLGLDRPNMTLLLLSLAILIFADIMKHRKVCLREVIIRQDGWCQAVIIGLSATAILLFGIWGSQYNAANFIYFQF